MSDYTAQILVSHPEPVMVFGHLSYFKGMVEGPLSDGLEIRAAQGWTAEELAGWLEGELDDPELVVVVTIEPDFEGSMVTATVGRVEQLAGA